MASAQYKTAIVVEAARARMVELQFARDEAKEAFIQKYMLQDLTDKMLEAGPDTKLLGYL